MPKYIPNIHFSDCWSSVGNVTFYHRNGICYFRSKPYSQFSGTPDQLIQADLHKRAINAWQSLEHTDQLRWRKLADGVASHKPPFGHKNSISGYNLFISAYHGFAQLGDEHCPTPRPFEPFPIFSMDYLGGRKGKNGMLELNYRLTLCGTTTPERYRVLAKIQIEEPGAGRNPGKMRNCLSHSIPSTVTSEVLFEIPDSKPNVHTKQLHIRYLLLDTITGYRSQYHSLSSLFI